MIQLRIVKLCVQHLIISQLNYKPGKSITFHNRMIIDSDTSYLAVSSKLLSSKCPGRCTYVSPRRDTDINGERCNPIKREGSTRAQWSRGSFATSYRMSAQGSTAPMLMPLKIVYHMHNGPFFGFVFCFTFFSARSADTNN